MTFDISQWLKNIRKGAQEFEIKPWMTVAVLVLMLGLLGLGLVAWIVPGIAQAVMDTPVPPTVIATAAITDTVATPIPTPSIPPTPTPIPQVYVVWTETASVYLLAEPGASIIAAIPNGKQVEIRSDDADTTIGGILWKPVRYEMVDGWLAEYEISIIQDGYLLLGEPGTSLFKETEGSIDRWLSEGTPYHVIEEQDHWIRVLLPDEIEGWISKNAVAVP